MNFKKIELLCWCYLPCAVHVDSTSNANRYKYCRYNKNSLRRLFTIIYQAEQTNCNYSVKQLLQLRIFASGTRACVGHVTSLYIKRCLHTFVLERGCRRPTAVRQCQVISAHCERDGRFKVGAFLVHNYLVVCLQFYRSLNLSSIRCCVI
jgi:hypothetical protein